MGLPAIGTPSLQPNTSMTAGMLMKAPIWVPSIIALIRTHPTATPIPIAEMAFTAANLVPVVGREGQIFGLRGDPLGRPKGREADACAPFQHGLGDLLGRLGHDDLGAGRERHVG